ncbi:MarR family winged helix-turn-helix transcriptional regulator [Glutamicibacter sp. NPDC087344]|uniref:MarR family winged helix-turn-helix transcriptional regulator n=1 Tax=Glutamicibacter sp. NPDC087344 TaxID=3363994 RepID=UPI00381290C9
MNNRPLGLMIWLRMARFVQRSNQISNEFLSQSGLSIAQFEVLNHIKAYQPVTQTDLGSRLTVTGGGISRMLSRLESCDLISRDTQWKTKYISLTDKGQRLIDSIYSDQVRLQASMFDDVLTQDEQKQLYTLMRKIHKNSLTKTAPQRASSIDPAANPSPTKNTENPS